MTPANLMSAFHRSIEAVQTGAVLRRIFSDEGFFAHHLPLPRTELYWDEGAANHTRLAAIPGGPGVHLFVHDHSADRGTAGSQKYPARQSRCASEAIARLHLLDPSQTVHAQQNPAAIDLGVFHNDLIAVGCESVLLFHEEAFANKKAVLSELRAAVGDTLILLEIPTSALSVSEAVASYLFNSQIIPLGDGTLGLISPAECEHSEPTRQAIEGVLASENPIQSVHYLDVHQSMRNGGGPASLRLRVALTPQELQAAHGPCLLTRERCQELEAWVQQHYREELRFEDLGDPSLVTEGQTALEELSQILELPRLYEFQR